MVRTRLTRMILAVALTLALGGPAAAEPSSWSGGWFEDGVDRISAWWSTVWTGVRGASEASPEIDPNGGRVTPELDPDGVSFTESAPTSDGEVTPELDPNG